MGSTLESPPAAPGGSPEFEGRTSRAGRRRRALGIVAAVVVVVVAAVAVAISDPFAGTDKPANAVNVGGAPTSLATVRQGPLASDVNASGTLGYVAQSDGSPYQVVNEAVGAFTALPTAGQVVACGQVLYRVANNPVALLCGSTPAYRTLVEGDSGPDVTELNANLVDLGYATKAALDPTSDYFGAETAYALEQLQGKLGEDETGSLDLGQAVLMPGPLRISTVQATLGSPARAGAPVAQATATTRQVQVQLDAAEQSSVRVGDKTLVTLPDNQTTPGTVTRIGTVASSSGSGGSGGGSSSGSASATIPIYITLKHPSAGAGLDQAPVQVQITTAGIRNAVIVPVNALLAQPGGVFAVEVVDSRGAHHLVPVTLGLFDDADGLVQVTSGALTAGEQIVVSST